MIKVFAEKIFTLNNRIKSIFYFVIDFLFSQISFFLSFFLLYEELYYLNLKYFLYQIFVTSSFVILFYYNGIYSSNFRFFNIFRLIEFVKVNLYNLISLIVIVMILKTHQITLIYGASYALLIIYSFVFLFFSSFFRSLAVIFYNSLINKKKKIINIIGLDRLSKIFIKNYSKQLYDIKYIFDNSINSDTLFNNIKILDIEQLSIIFKKKFDILVISKEYFKYDVVQNLIKYCKKNKIEIKTFDSKSLINDINNFDNNYFSKIDLEDLIDRKVSYESTLVGNFFEKHNILVTGAGGSIGSNLCEQLIKNNTKELICLDNSEINLFNLKSRLNARILFYKSITKVSYVLMDLGNYKNVEKLFLRKKISFIFHTAAYKHVNIVEENKVEAFINNVIHFSNLLNLSFIYNIKNFTLISSDKAVQPKNFMGLTKKICEEIFIHNTLKKFPLKKLNYKVVRFGNVFNSSGSVIPVFKDQISNGGPVTITSNKTTRFFMSIPEAVNLILSAQILSNNYGIFVLEMGRAVSILEIAKKLIFLNSLTSNLKNNNIEIKEIGLREGEKEHEILTDGKIIKTKNNSIHEVIEERYSLNQIKLIMEVISDFKKSNQYEEKLNKLIQSLLN